MNKISYLIYFVIYSLISYKTDLGFEYGNGFELLWGSIVTALISGIIGNLIFRLSYDWTGFLSALLQHSRAERRSVHWLFRLIFSIPVLIFSLSPLCPLLMTPLVHHSFVYVSGCYNRILNQLIEEFSMIL